MVWYMEVMFLTNVCREDSSYNYLAYNQGWWERLYIKGPRGPFTPWIWLPSWLEHTQILLVSNHLLDIHVWWSWEWYWNFGAYLNESWRLQHHSIHSSNATLNKLPQLATNFVQALFYIRLTRIFFSNHQSYRDSRKLTRIYGSPMLLTLKGKWVLSSFNVLWR